MLYSREKSAIRTRTKQIARRIMFETAFRLVFVLALSFATGAVFGSISGLLADRFFGEWTQKLWKYTVNPAHPAIFAVLSFAAIPMSLGAVEYFLAAVRKKDRKISELFLWYSEKEKLKTCLRYWPWQILVTAVSYFTVTMPLDFILEQMTKYSNALLDAVAQVGSAAAREQVAALSEMLDMPGIWASGGLLVLGLLISIPFFVVDYLIVDGKSAGPFSAAADSVRIMSGHFAEYIVFVLSFAGWFIGVGATGWILALYAAPYYTAASAVFAEYIRKDYELRTGKGAGFPAAEPAETQGGAEK